MKIYFGTPTFDRITKDQKANFATKLSTVGGTMGLMTGFSVISGVEFVYFVANIFVVWIRSLQKKDEDDDDDNPNKVVSLAQ